MKHYQKSALISSQKSVLYPLNLLNKDNSMKLPVYPNYFTQPYPTMLIEDVAAGVMPLIGSDKKKVYLTQVEGKNSEVESLVSMALNRSDYRSDFKSTVSRFFYKCASRIVLFGESPYEIVYFSEPDNGTIVRFEFLPIMPQTIVHRSGKMIQYIPPYVAKARNKPEYVELIPENILVFKLPAYVQDKFPYIMKSLSELSYYLLPPPFYLEEMKSGLIKTPYDFKIHNLTQKQALAEITKFIGWNARNLLKDKQLEYYQLYRMLLFKKFEIELRNSMLKTLNEKLVRVGHKIGFSAQIKVEGLMTLDDVNAAKKHLLVGDMEFTKIVNQFI